jgi:hypothetical protein
MVHTRSHDEGVAGKKVSLRAQTRFQQVVTLGQATEIDVLVRVSDDGAVHHSFLLDSR